MSFHPLMVYDRSTSTSRSARVVDEGPPFMFTPERRAALDDILTKYPPDRKRSAVLAALYLVQEQQGYLTASGMRHVARHPRHDAGRSRGRRDLLRDVLPGAGRQVRAAGVPHAVVRADRRRARDRGALARSSGIKVGETDASGMFTLLEFECLGACDRAPVVMVNNEHWHERVRRRRTPAKLVDDIRAKGDAAFNGCHLKVEKMHEPQLWSSVRAGPLGGAARRQRIDGTDSHQIRPRAEQLHARLLPEARGLRGAEEGARR